MFQGKLSVSSELQKHNATEGVKKIEAAVFTGISL